MKKISLVLLSIMMTVVAFSQDEQCDSLFAKARKYDELYNFRKSYETFSAARDCYSECGMKTDVASCLSEMAWLLSELNVNDSAKILFSEAESLAISNHDTILALSILRAERRFYYYLNDVQSRTRIALLIDSLQEGITDVMTVFEYDVKDCREAMDFYKDFDQAEHCLMRHRPLFSQLSEEERLYCNGQIDILMRDLRRKQKRYGEAIEYGLRYLNYRRNTPKVTDVSLAMQYVYLSDIYSFINDTANTVLYADSTMYCAYKYENPAISSAFGTATAIALQRVGQYKKAIEILEWSDSTIMLSEDKTLEDILTIRQAKTVVSYREQRFDECVRYYDAVIDLSRQKYGEHSEDYSRDLYNFSKVLGLTHDYARASEYAILSSQILRDVVHDNIQAVSSTDFSAYWPDVSNRLFNISSIAVNAGETSSPLTLAAYESLLFSRSLLFESSLSIDKLVKSSGSSEASKLHESVKAMKSQLKMIQKNEKNADVIANLKDSLITAEQRLTVLIPSYGTHADFLELKYSDIVKSLPRRSILVEFFDYHRPSDKQQVYLAFVVDTKRKYPLLLQLFTENEFDSILDGQRVSSLYSPEHNDVARRLIWDKIAQYVPKGYDVYYVPSGVLHQVSLESFKADNGQLLSKRNGFFRLSSGRELPRFDQQMSRPLNIQLYGGLTYDTTLFDNNYEYLPGTADEVNDIAAIAEAGGAELTLLSGADGTIASLSALSHKAPQIIHIATHGYYFTPGEAQEVDLLKGYTDAMMLSGLIMSGSNISANEISQLDLSSTSLVVISACQSGVGNSTPEGLYGLQRAFKQAGVRTLVMTLWNIDDKVTRRFMAKFYERLVATGWDRHRAFREARSFIIGQYPESPNLWACFVMID